MKRSFNKENQTLNKTKGINKGKQQLGETAISLPLQATMNQLEQVPSKL